MWKFLPRVSKPKSKRKVDTRESNKVYDATKRKRNFRGGHAQTPLADSGCFATLTTNTGLDIFLQD
jgi:hypothetical protein